MFGTPTQSKTSARTDTTIEWKLGFVAALKK